MPRKKIRNLFPSTIAKKTLKNISIKKISYTPYIMREHFLNNPLPNTYHLGMKTMKQLDTINPPCVREWSKLKEGGRPYPPAHSLDVKTLEKRYDDR